MAISERFGQGHVNRMKPNPPTCTTNILKGVTAGQDCLMGYDKMVAAIFSALGIPLWRRILIDACQAVMTDMAAREPFTL